MKIRKGETALPRSKKEQEKQKEEKNKTKAKRMKTKQEEKKEKTKKKEETKKKEVKQREKPAEEEEKINETQTEEKITISEENTIQEQDKKETVIEQKKDETKDLVVKGTLNEIQLEKIEKEIKKQTTISEEKKKKINAKVFQNIIIAIIVVLYFIFLNLGFKNLKPQTFLKDLQVFSIITIGITIILFEKAYQKDSGEITIYGIEALVLSICTLMTIYLGANYTSKFTYILNAISMLFAIYYVAKAIVIYRKMMKKALKQTSDIHKIAKS